MHQRQRRRDFIALVGSVACGWPLFARAQAPPRMIGVLSSVSYGAYPGTEDAFLKGLKDAGFIEGSGVSIEWRWAQGHYDRLPSLASELVSRGTAVIVCFDAPASFAVKAATGTIPILFVTGADPVETGLVDSFSRPGGNLTGVSILIITLLPKQLELVGELLPAANTIALLANASNPNFRSYAPEAQVASKALGRRVQMLTASTEGDLDTAFAAVHQWADALVVIADPFFIARREQIVALAARYAVATIYPNRFFPEVGGLVSYGTPVVASYQQLGTYTGKILRGAKPADLPVQQSTNVELVINLTTAKALGLTIPPSLLARADEVIE
jgi:putative tryptophan/tyrosine transport system substrate-binding protein